MATLVLGARALNNRIKSISLPNVNFKFVYILGIATCLLLSVFYVFAINQLTSGAYTIKNYNKEVASLSKENRTMEAQVADSGLLDQIHVTVNQLGFEKTSEIKYVEIVGTSVASAR